MKLKKELEEIIGGIKNIDDFYQVFDKEAIILEVNHDIREFILMFRNKIASKKEKQLVKWELEIFLFSFQGNHIFSFSNSNGKEAGEVVEYPALDNFQNKGFNYIKGRASKCTSTLLRARYNHVLWESVITKNRDYAFAAVENYLKTIEQCSIIIKDNNDYLLLIGTLYENVVGIVNQVGFGIEQLKKLTRFLLFKSTQIPFWTRHGIIEDMLKYPKLFKSLDFKNVLKIFEERLNVIDEKGGDFMLVNYYLPTAVKIAQKTKNDVKKWYNEIGYTYLRIAAKETENKRNWIKLDNYRAAIDAFRLSNNKSKKEETEQLYFELKPKVRLDKFRVDFDEVTIKKLQKLQEALKKKALILLNESPNHIYSRIANGGFFPKYSDVLKASKEKPKRFMDFANTLYFDNNKNISKQGSNTENLRQVLETYGERVQGTLLPFLHYLIISGIKSGHLTSKNFLQFLISYSWIGKPDLKPDLSGDIEETNWIFQIAPSIVEFFDQVLAWGESKYYNPNFILCTDSLTLKIEGLFRNFSERLNVSTSRGKRKGMQEVLVHDVINNETIKKYFDEDDMLLFEYVFSSDGGLNLRNNIAHCFYNENEYHPDKMLLLLAVLLRLGKYNISIEK